jgi:hypothetical protein
MNSARKAGKVIKQATPKMPNKQKPQHSESFFSGLLFKGRPVNQRGNRRQSMAQRGPCSSVDPRNNRIRQADSSLLRKRQVQKAKIAKRNAVSRPVHMPNTRAHPFETDQAGRITFVCRRVSFGFLFCFKFFA